MKTRPRWMVARDVKEEESLWFRGGANLGFDFDFDVDDDDDGLPAYSHNDKIPPWWGNVSNDKVGNESNSHHT